jgi:Terminase large subunit, T4likevirus-type, N-terminal
MNVQEQLALALDPSLILKAQGMDPDPWQRDFLLCQARFILLNCCRGAGKTRTTSALALHTALFQPKSLTQLISIPQRQAKELLRHVKQGYRAIGRPVDTIKENETELEYPNGSRNIALPGSEGTIRSFQGVNLLVIDEAAHVPDGLYASVSPLTQTSKGRTILLSTPYGQRGFFWHEWPARGVRWSRSVKS